MKKIVEDTTCPETEVEVSYHVEPFSVQVLGKKDEEMCKQTVFVQLPESIVINGKRFFIPTKKRKQLANVGRNIEHNIRRDVRRFLREEFWIIVPFRTQYETIEVNFTSNDLS
jgi:hypothetical protein